MRKGCVHATSIDSVPAPRDACEACIVEGTRWVHLRQCLTCGQTLCCDASPRRHMTGHWAAIGHPVMRGADPGDDWVWCYADDELIREVDGGWATYDPFVTAGAAVVAEHVARGGTLDLDAGYVMESGFPLGEWVGYVREAQAAGDLDPIDETAIEAVPGWRWDGGNG